MRLILDKSLEDLNNQVIQELRNAGLSTTPGSICKLILLIYNKILGNENNGFYTCLRLNHMQAFLSTATNEFLDAIGKLLDCTRLYNEKDESYRDRISKQVHNMAKANETSIRLAALSIENVQDVIINKFSYGTGSFSMFIVTDSPIATESTLIAVNDAVEKVVGCGIKYTVLNPTLLKTKLKYKLIISSDTTDTERQEIISSVLTAVKDYFSTLTIGGPIIPNQLTEYIMSVSQKIINYNCVEFIINNRLANYSFQDCRKSERFILSPEQDSLIVN